MKKSFMSISMLVVSISMLALFLCSSVANAQSSSKFIYDKSDNAETVYTLDKTGKYLTPKLKYEFSKDESTNKGMKKAYKWNADSKKWVPYYLLTVTEVGNDSVVEYAAWDSQNETFSLDFQKAVYNVGLENEILSYMFYKWNTLSGVWEMNQHILFGEYLAQNINSVN